MEWPCPELRGYICGTANYLALIGNPRFEETAGRYFRGDFVLKSLQQWFSSRNSTAKSGSEDIFISYAREDAPIANSLASALKREGWSVFFDAHIPIGKTFDEFIEETITRARCVVVLWSKNSVKSRWVKVEAQLGEKRGILIPASLMTDIDQVPLQFRFLETVSLVGWEGESSHQGYQSLVAAISNLLQWSEQRPPTVFISYTHDSSEHDNRVLTLADRLRSDGINADLDQYHTAPLEGWRLWRNQQIHEADFVLMVCTEPHYRRIMGTEEPELYHYLYDAGAARLKFVPILFSGSDAEHIPLVLREMTYFLVDTQEGYEALYRLLTKQPIIRTSRSSKLRRALPPRDALADFIETRGGSQPLLEGKLILVGFGGVGKTSIVNRLINGSFDPLEHKTDGIKITDCSFTLDNRENIALHIWDFGGQEIMHATHQFFLTPHSLYLLVLNGRQGREDADADYWLTLINSFAGSSPVIIILNKIKQCIFDIDRRAIQHKFTNVCAFVETDCEEGTGLDLLDRTIRVQIDSLPGLRNPFPAAWCAIKRRLASMREEFLSFERYRTICAELGENDHCAQEELAGFLHRLGLALNFREDVRLRDTHVLNPRWITEGIYTIINHPDLAKQRGELSLAKLVDILDPQKYPPERHAFIIELMRKFELCFLFPDSEDHYLIPEMLDKQEPEETARFKQEDCLNFQYCYPTMIPEGLLPRFIVRTYVRSMTVPRWRTGVVLNFEGNSALVKANHIERRVEISVDGPAAGRRRLLAVVRNEFASIHTGYKFRPEEMVPVPGHPTAVIPYAKLLVLERNRVQRISEVIGEDVVEFNVAELLDGVDWERTRATLSKSGLATSALRAFISYSHKDESLRAEFEAHLKLLHRQGLLDLWHDRIIGAGTEWVEQINENIERADVILLLVSADFIASDYCYDKEMKRAMERHGNMARVIPVIIRDCKWQSAPFGKLQALPTGGKAVATWGPDQFARDRAWTDVADGVEKALNDLRYRVS